MFRRVLRDSSFYGLLSVFSKAVTFLSFFLYVNYFSKSEIAVIEILISFQFIIMVLTSGQLESGYVRFYFSKPDSHFRNSLLVGIVQALVLTTLIGALFLWFFRNYFLGDLVDSSTDVFVFCYAILINFYNLINLKFRYADDKKNFALFVLSLPLLTLFTIWFLVVHRNGSVISLFEAYTFSLAFVLLAQVLLVSRAIDFKNCLKIEYVPIFKYCLPFVPVVLITTGSDKLLVFLYREYWSDELIADYSVAMRLATMLGLALGALKMACDTTVNRYICDSIANERSFLKLFNIYLIVSFCLYLLFIIFLPLINVLFLGGKYEGAIQIAALLGITLIMLNMVMFTSPGFCITNKTHYRIYLAAIQFALGGVGAYLILDAGGDVFTIFFYLSLVSFVGLLLNMIWSNRLHKLPVSYTKVFFSYAVLVTSAACMGKVSG